MIFQWAIHLVLIFSVSSKEILKFITRSHTSHLNKYKNYLDTTLLHFQIPSDAFFASLKIEVEEKEQTLFSCKPENVQVYLKQGSPPVINPDGSKFPPEFHNISRPEPHFINFTSQSPPQYLNSTSPIPGIYFLSAFLAYTDPRYDGINQEGLVPKCHVYLDVTLYIMLSKNVEIVTKNVETPVSLSSLNNYAVYKFWTSENVDHVLVTVNGIRAEGDWDFLSVRIQPYNVPSISKSIKSLDIPAANFTKQNHYVSTWTAEKTWYYVRFEFTNSTEDEEEVTSLAKKDNSFTFRITYFSSPETSSNDTALEIDVNETNSDTYVPDPMYKLYRDRFIWNRMFYNEYDLVRERNSENYIYAYDLRPRKNGKIPLYLNITDDVFTILKFVIQDETDIGGTAQVHLGLKPKVKNVDGKRMIETAPDGHHLIACIRKDTRQLPMWPANCSSFDMMPQVAPVFINKTVENGSVLIPYPEAGTWYVSIRLFCGPCEPCNCPENCQNSYENCTENCEKLCKYKQQCDNCSETCRASIVGQSEKCKGCDCVGGCRRNNVSCNSSLIFEVSSFSCIDGSCGDNGKCVFSISEGFVLTSCICSNNYRGWDCSDASLANSYLIIVLEMILLTLSNLMFIPAVYLAFKRQYYVEALVYLALCLSSTFYHACDAGENIISYCLTRLNVLQFSDFFCALLSLWVTLIAIASLTEPCVSILHMLGAIVLAFGTTYNKMSVWSFALPTLAGILIISVSWFTKYRQLKHVFPSKRYLKRNFSVGIIVVVVGLVTFAFLQTRSNYKYLHSMWHVLMAIGIIILLPDKTTFIPSNL